MSDPVVIVGYARTAMGAMLGAFSELPATELGGASIAGAMADAGVEAADVEEVIMGCVLPAGMGQSPARQAALAAGIPSSVLTNTINKVCGSGLKSLISAHRALQLGELDIAVAGGMESMTRAPYILNNARSGMRLGHGQVLDHMFLDGLQDAYSGELMGIYAEATAEKYGFSRQQQDAYALESLTRALKAIDAGKFKREIVPVPVATRKGDVLVETDEHPGNVKPEKIPLLRPAFKADGTVTAANASSIADGAAAVVMARESVARAHGLRPVAKIVAYAEHAHEPEWFTTAPVSAVKHLLQKANWSVEDVDLFEVNEAFAVVVLTAIKLLGLDHSKVNVHGGACSLGHPLGASGTRVLCTLLAALECYGKQRGIASLCIGGGEGIAIAVEMIC